MQPASEPVYTAAAAVPTPPPSFSRVCTLLLHSEQHQYCVQDATTFSRLLCVSRQLQEELLPAATGCLQLKVSKYQGCVTTSHCLVQWIAQHLALGTLRHIEVEASDFHPVVHEALAQLLATEDEGGAHAAQPKQQCSGAWPVRSLQRVLTMLAAGSWAAAEPSRASAVVKPTAAAAADPVSGPIVPAAWSSHKRPMVTLSWHVCGLPPSSLSLIPGAQLTSLTLRDIRVSTATLQELARLTALQQLHLPNLNPNEPASLATALAALTTLTALFIRSPCQQLQQALPVSLQQLTVAQRTPPWVEAPTLVPLTIRHLTALHSLTIHEWFAQGITADYVLPSSLQHLTAPCISSAAPLLLNSKQSRVGLKTLQLSSLKHSSTEQLLNLSSLRSALTAVQLGSDAPPSASARLSADDLRVYAQVFKTLPVFVTALTVQAHPKGSEAGGLCRTGLDALAGLKHCLQCLNIEGSRMSSPSSGGGGGRSSGGGDGSHPSTEEEGQLVHAVTPILLSTVLAALTALTKLRLCHLQLEESEQPSQQGSSSSASNTDLSDGGSSSSTSGATQGSVGTGTLLHGSPTDGVSCEQQPVLLMPQRPVAAAGDSWLPVLNALAALPRLRILACTGVPLGPAAMSLTAAVGLQEIELQDCSVPDAVVNTLINQLAASTALGCQSLTVRKNPNGSMLRSAAAPETACSAMSGGCLTCLRFSRH